MESVIHNINDNVLHHLFCAILKHHTIVSFMSSTFCRFALCQFEIIIIIPEDMHCNLWLPTIFACHFELRIINYLVQYIAKKFYVYFIVLHNNIFDLLQFTSSDNIVRQTIIL